MNTVVIVVVAVAAVVLVAWGVLALVTHISGKKFDRAWEKMSPEERRRVQEQTREANLFAQARSSK